MRGSTSGIIHCQWQSILTGSHVWSQWARNVPLEEWLNNGLYTRAWLEDLAKKLNSSQVIDPHRDGFFVELTFVKPWFVDGKMEGKKKKSWAPHVGITRQEKTVRGQNQKQR